jgi:hypothetical protein
VDQLRRAAGGKGWRGRSTLPSTKGYTGHSTPHSASVCCSMRVNNSNKQPDYLIKQNGLHRA